MVKPRKQKGQAFLLGPDIRRVFKEGFDQLGTEHTTHLCYEA